MASIDDVLNSYSAFLHNEDQKTADRFDRNRKSDSEASIAEAITFQILQTIGAHPKIHDKVGTGGPDFQCDASRFPQAGPQPQNQFMVEATSLNQNAISERSQLSKDMPEGIHGGAYGLVTKNIFSKVSKKDKQFEDCSMPGVLTIVSSHLYSALLFDSNAAETAFVSGSYFKHEIGSAVTDPANYTDLKDSVFMKPGPDGSIIAYRQNISAILLISLYRDYSEIFGILHPEPKFPLNIGLFPNIPFIKLSQWPIVDGRIATEWVVGRPDGFRVPLHHV
jgi:hypothetical protein